MTHAASRALTTIVTLCVTALVLRALAGETMHRAPRIDDDGTLLLRQGRGVWAVGIVCGVAIPLALLAVLIFAPPTRPGQTTPLVGLIVGFAVLGAPVLVMAARSWARVSSWGIEARGAFGAASRLPWGDVAAVDYSGLRGALLFRDHAGTVTVPVSIMAVGLPLLLNELRHHMDPEAYEPAVTKGLRQLGQAA